MISVVLADDQSLIRTAVAELVSHEEGFSVAGQAGNGREAVDLVRDTRPDIVLMDIRMPVMDGIQATAAICADPSPGGDPHHRAHHLRGRRIRAAGVARRGQRFCRQGHRGGRA